jgi:hypothetical protein
VCSSRRNRDTFNKILSKFFKTRSQKCQVRLPTKNKEGAVKTHPSKTQQFAGRSLPSDLDPTKGFLEPQLYGGELITGRLPTVLEKIPKFHLPLLAKDKLSLTLPDGLEIGTIACS